MALPSQTNREPSYRNTQVRPQRLRVMMSSLFLTLTVLFVGLWVLSYKSHGTVQGQLTSSRGFSAMSWRGRLTANWVRFSGQAVAKRRAKWEYESIPADIYQAMLANAIGAVGASDESSVSLFGVTRGAGHVAWIAWCPHWFLVFACFFLTLLLKPQPRLKFSTRELLMFVTVTAAVLGAVAWLGGGF